MEEKFEFTKEKLVKAFLLWDTEAVNNPSDFTEIEPSEDYAKNQAEDLISYLKIC